MFLEKQFFLLRQVYLELSIHVSFLGAERRGLEMSFVKVVREASIQETLEAAPGAAGTSSEVSLL